MVPEVTGAVLWAERGGGSGYGVQAARAVIGNVAG